MRLEAIVQSKLDAGRCTLILNGGEKIKSFTAVVADMGLYGGMELDNDKLEELSSSSRRMGAKARAARIAGAAPVSKKQLIRKLKDKGESEENALGAAEWLEELGAVNDEEYAAMLARSLAARGYGRARIKQKFREKGIDRELWEQALADLPDLSGQIDKYVSSHLSAGETDRKAIKKVSDALIRRGFSWSEVSESLARVLRSDISEE